MTVHKLRKHKRDYRENATVCWLFVHSTTNGYVRKQPLKTSESWEAVTCSKCLKMHQFYK